jgi:chromosome segregation ATPase
VSTASEKRVGSLADIGIGHDEITLQTTQLSTLPASIAHLRASIQSLRAAQSPASSNPDLALPLQPSLDLLNSREQELADIDAQIAELHASLPAKRQEVGRLQDELAPLQARKIKAVQEAQEARRRMEQGRGLGDGLEEKGRWLRECEGVLREMLEV